jgi:glycosyltransferase involved in cell wall biosynthesis
LATNPKHTENPYLRAVWEFAALPRLIKQLKVDLLFCPGGSVGRRIPKGCKVATTFQNMMPFDLRQRRKYPLGAMRLRNWLLEKVLFSSMLRSDLVIFISEYAKSVIAARAKERHLRSVVIPHGINPVFRKGPAPLPRPGWLPEEGYFLYVSTLDVYKAQLEVIEAYSILKRIRKTPEKLVLVGPEYAAYADMVRGAITARGLTNDVLVIGNVPHEDLPAAYQNSLANIFASETENCPFILLEALGAGRPLFVSSRPPMPEFGGDAVVYFDPSRPEELASRLEKVIGDVVMMESLAELAFERSLKYQWDHTATRTWEAFQALTEGLCALQVETVAPPPVETGVMS